MAEKVTRVERTTTTSATEPVVTPAEQTTTTTRTTTHTTTAQPKNVNVNVTEGAEGATSVNVPTTPVDEPTNINVNG